MPAKARKSQPSSAKIFTDGCSKGNPGTAGAGFVVQDLDGEVLKEGSFALGHATNNEAEYRALILAMECCITLKISAGYFFTDSELMVRQIKGIYRIKNPRLIELAGEVARLKSHFDRFEIVHVPRASNQHADKLANQAIASGSGGDVKKAAR